MIKIHSIDQKHFELTIPSSISGTHIFQKEGDYTKDQINKFFNICEEVDSQIPSRDQAQLESVFARKITESIDPRVSNSEYNKNKPSYFFSA